MPAKAMKAMKAEKSNIVPAHAYRIVDLPPGTKAFEPFKVPNPMAVKKAAMKRRAIKAHTAAPAKTMKAMKKPPQQRSAMKATKLAAMKATLPRTYVTVCTTYVRTYVCTYVRTYVRTHVRYVRTYVRNVYVRTYVRTKRWCLVCPVACAVDGKVSI